MFLCTCSMDNTSMNNLLHCCLACLYITGMTTLSQLPIHQTLHSVRRCKQAVKISSLTPLILALIVI